MSNWIWSAIVLVLALACRFFWRKWRQEIEWHWHYALMWNGLTSELSEDNKAVLRGLERIHGLILPYRATQTSETPVRPAPERHDSPNQGTLRVTQSGLDYVNSSAYTLEMTGMIGLYYKPDSAFYDLLLATTALHLSGADPASCGRAAFQKFMEENIQVIRAVIDRLKESHPAISMSEEAWERAREQTRTTD